MVTSSAKLDLSSANLLMVGDRVGEQDILAQILMGFGVTTIHRCMTAEDALDVARRERFDLALIDSGLKGMDGYELIKTIRHSPEVTLKHLPIMVVCGHIRRSEIEVARDCGASFVLTKPISAKVLFDRIVWLAHDTRQFIDSEGYIGPDRRFKAFGPPPGQAGRRAGDLSANVGEAKEANLSQDVVDDFFSPKKAVL